VKATFHGHACFVVERDGKRVIIDPFLTGNPAADIGPDQLPRLDAILLSHELMLVPIGDNYAMGVEDAARGVEFLKPKSVIQIRWK
jgi:L-ascorbate metabolism protein UlaG (beta-lactamase superfamily)